MDLEIIFNNEFENYIIESDKIEWKIEKDVWKVYCVEKLYTFKIDIIDYFIFEGEKYKFEHKITKF